MFKWCSKCWKPSTTVAIFYMGVFGWQHVCEGCMTVATVNVKLAEDGIISIDKLRAVREQLGKMLGKG